MNAARMALNGTLGLSCGTLVGAIAFYQVALLYGGSVTGLAALVIITIPALCGALLGVASES